MTEKNSLQESDQPNRLQILIRLLWTIVYLILLEGVKIVVQFTVLLDYIHLLVYRTSNERLRSFGNRLSAYGYRILRFTTLNENAKPWPFSDWPADIEPPAAKIDFDPS